MIVQNNCANRAICLAKTRLLWMIPSKLYRKRKNSKVVTKSDQGAWWHPRVLYLGFFSLGVVLAVVGTLTFRGQPVSARKATDSSTSAPLPDSANVSSGRWGSLVCEKVLLEESSQTFADHDQRLQAPRWVFDNYSREQLTNLLDSCQFKVAERSWLLDQSHWESLPHGFAISPPDMVVMSLSSASRQRLYWALATNSANYPQFIPFNFPIAGIDERFADSGLSAAKIDLIRKLTYPGYGYLWLAVDRPLLQAFDANELRRFNRVLYSYPIWMLHLQVKPDSDVNALVQYWGSGREKKLRPLLESVAKSPGGKNIDIASLLPVFAQTRLDTFPDPEVDPAVVQEDCFYTAMNFFNNPPDAGFKNIAYTKKVLDSAYRVTTPPGRFGDVVIINDPNGNGIHACVYIADDFVFTKNGGNSERPWVIMKMADVLACFPSEGTQHLVFWRRKGA